MTDATLVGTQPVADETAVSIADLDNGSLAIRLAFTINHLSRWLTPIHDQTRLVRAARRGEPSVKQLLLEMRNEELRVFPKMYVISVKTMPDLDKLPLFALTASQVAFDQQSTPLEVMAEFRRLRQSTTSLLRSLVDSAWGRQGHSRREHTWTIRTLAEHLAAHDYAVLSDLDVALDQAHARDGIAEVSRVHLPELLTLLPVRLRTDR